MKNNKLSFILIIVFLIWVQPSGAGVVWPQGSLEINGSPIGLDIDIDGENFGIVPANGSLFIESISATNHEILAKKPGYKPELKEIEIVENGTAKVDFFLQISPPGTLEVTSNPQNVKVFIGEKYYGITPITIPELNEGMYELKLSLDHYQDNITSIGIKAGQTTSINAILNPFDRSSEESKIKSPGFGFLLSSLALILGILWFKCDKEGK